MGLKGGTVPVTVGTLRVAGMRARRWRLEFSALTTGGPLASLIDEMDTAGQGHCHPGLPVGASARLRYRTARLGPSIYMPSLSTGMPDTASAFPPSTSGIKTNR